MNTRQWVNVLAVLATIAFNLMAEAVPLNGQTTGEVANRFPIYFFPAGYVFSIWGLIYVGLLAFAFYQALPSQRDDPRLHGITPWFVLSSLGNIGWLLLWHYNAIALSALPILLLLVSLVAIYLRLDTGRGPASTAEAWLLWAPFSIYLAWSSVATIADFSIVLWSLGWNGAPLAPEVWAIVMMVVAGALAGLATWTRNDFLFSLVVAWALIGIAARYPTTQPLAGAAWIVSALVLLAAAFSILRRRRLYGVVPLAS